MLLNGTSTMCGLPRMVSVCPRTFGRAANGEPLGKLLDLDGLEETLQILRKIENDDGSGLA